MGIDDGWYDGYMELILMLIIILVAGANLAILIHDKETN